MLLPSNVKKIQLNPSRNVSQSAERNGAAYICHRPEPVRSGYSPRPGQGYSGTPGNRVTGVQSTPGRVVPATGQYRSGSYRSPAGSDPDRFLNPRPARTGRCPAPVPRPHRPPSGTGSPSGRPTPFAARDRFTPPPAGSGRTGRRPVPVYPPGRLGPFRSPSGTGLPPPGRLGPYRSPTRAGMSPGPGRVCCKPT